MKPSVPVDPPRTIAHDDPSFLCTKAGWEKYLAERDAYFEAHPLIAESPLEPSAKADR